MTSVGEVAVRWHERAAEFDEFARVEADPGRAEALRAEAASVRRLAQAMVLDHVRGRVLQARPPEPAPPELSEPESAADEASPRVGAPGRGSAAGVWPPGVDAEAARVVEAGW